MRGAVLYLIAVTALIGCGDTHKASGPEATSGGEIVARRAVGSTTTALTQNSLEIYVIDVGQGDSTLIVGPGPDEERFTMLIDAGNYTSGSNGAAFVRPILDFADVTYLDVVIATHFDADHIGKQSSPAVSRSSDQLANHISGLPMLLHGGFYACRGHGHGLIN